MNAFFILRMDVVVVRTVDEQDAPVQVGSAFDQGGTLLTAVPEIRVRIGLLMFGHELQSGSSHTFLLTPPDGHESLGDAHTFTYTGADAATLKAMKPHQRIIVLVLLLLLGAAVVGVVVT